MRRIVKAGFVLVAVAMTVVVIVRMPMRMIVTMIMCRTAGVILLVRMIALMSVRLLMSVIMCMPVRMILPMLRSMRVLMAVFGMAMIVSVFLNVFMLACVSVFAFFCHFSIPQFVLFFHSPFAVPKNQIRFFLAYEAQTATVGFDPISNHPLGQSYPIRAFPFKASRLATISTVEFFDIKTRRWTLF
jgi:hypothetical protein